MEKMIFEAEEAVFTCNHCGQEHPLSDRHIIHRGDQLCSRCLDTICEELEFDVNERLAKSDIDEDVLIIDSSEFDLDETVIKSFGLELPINYMCSDNCRGLCHVCGCNLNHQNCDCEDDNVDPRLAALKDFLK